MMQKYLMEMTLWKKLGIPGSPLGDRPWKEVRDYFIVINALDREEAQRAKH